jgi:hypothetical protein
MSTQAQSRSASTRQMADTQSAPARPTPDMNAGIRPAPSPGTETKAAVKSTEFYIYLIAVAGVLVASQLVGRNSVGVDVFRADNAWFFITLLTIGYLVSRGLAKAGSAWRSSDDRGR